MDKNLETYTSKSVVKWYEALDFIYSAEESVFEQYKHVIANGSMLDIGIGGGRTTKRLLKNCKKYTGIDYSQEFVNVVKKKYPQADITRHDARDLSAFADNSFDFVNFSFNGIDYVDLQGREKIFSEIYRVLKPNGLFFFSTHNRNHNSFDEWPWNNKKINAWIKIKTFIKLLPFLRRKTLNQEFEIQNAEYAIINDSAHNYNLMTFYTSPLFLRSQLTKAKFISHAFYNNYGRTVPDGQLDAWIYVTAIKSS